MKQFVFVVAALLVCWAAVGTAAPVTLVNENFDSMGPGHGTVSPPAGWTVGYLGAAGSQNRLAMSPYAGNGQAITSMTINTLANLGLDYRSNDALGTVTDVGRPYNCGIIDAADRALGNYPRTSPSGDHIMQVAFSNTSGAPISSIHLEYDMEQWGWGQGTSSSSPPTEEERVLFSSTSATDGFQYMGDGFLGAAPHQGAGSGIQVIDGNAAGNFVHVSGDYTLPSTLDPGASMWLRWHDWNDNGTSDHLLAIDNVQVTTDVAAPEPSTLALALAGLGGLAVVAWRKRAAGRQS